MDNKLLLEGILWDLKGICDLAMHGAIESGTNKINKVFRDSLIELLDLQHMLYNVMSENDMYPVCYVEESKIEMLKEDILPSIE